MLIIKKTIPAIKSPTPKDKQIVLTGCPSLVIHAKAFNIQPKMIVKIESNIFVLLFIPRHYLQITSFYFFNSYNPCFR